MVREFAGWVFLHLGVVVVVLYHNMSSGRGQYKYLLTDLSESSGKQLLYQNLNYFKKGIGQRSNAGKRTILRILLLLSFSYAEIPMDEDSAGGYR